MEELGRLDNRQLYDILDDHNLMLIEYACKDRAAAHGGECPDAAAPDCAACFDAWMGAPCTRESLLLMEASA